MQTFLNNITTPELAFPTQKLHYYYHDYTHLDEEEEEFFDAESGPNFSYLNTETTPSSSSLPSETPFKSLSLGRKTAFKPHLTSLRRASIADFNTPSTIKRSCECKALDVKPISRTALATYPIRFLKYGVHLDLQSHETIQKTHWISNNLPSTWTGHTIYSFSCSLLLPNIIMYENDQPCSFQISKRYSEFRAFYLRLVCSLSYPRF
jgi:hypothetical protein